MEGRGQRGTKRYGQGNRDELEEITANVQNALILPLPSFVEIQAHKFGSLMLCEVIFATRSD